MRYYFTSIWHIEDKQELCQTYERAPRLTKPPTAHMSRGDYAFTTAKGMCIPTHRRRRRSPAVACWASDHWVASSNPLRDKFRH